MAKTFTVKVWLSETSQPLVHDNAKNAYQKGDMYCVYDAAGVVTKYPLSIVFRVQEDYNFWQETTDD